MAPKTCRDAAEKKNEIQELIGLTVFASYAINSRLESDLRQSLMIIDFAISHWHVMITKAHSVKINQNFPIRSKLPTFFFVF